MKNFDELNEDELRELKEHYYCENNENVSYGELADIDNLVSDEDLKNEYGETSFSSDDFFCNSEENHDIEI